MQSDTRRHALNYYANIVYISAMLVLYKMGKLLGRLAGLVYRTCDSRS